MTNMMEQMMRTKLKTSRSRVVMPVFGSLVNLAILPKTVWLPVDTTIAVHVPDTQWVP